MEVVHLGNFARVVKFRKATKFRSPYKNFAGLQIFATCDTVHAAFEFLTFFLSLFDCLPDLSPYNSYCFGYFGIL